MKQKLGFVIASIAFCTLLAVSLIHDSNANAAHSPEQAIKTTVLAYLNSVNTGDIDTMIQYTDDLRFPDKSVQKANYKGLKESVINISIQGLVPLTPTSYNVNISATVNGKTAEFAIPVVNKYGVWLVVIGQQQQQQ
jgi:hypothetical protein